MKILSLVTDAFGGRGGIAQFNRDMLGAVSGMPGVTALTAAPRLVPDAPGPLPAGLRYLLEGTGGKVAYVATVLREMRRTRYDVVHCGHLNLLPLAAWVAWRQRARLVLALYGIEAWRPASSLRRRLLRRVDVAVSISEFTRRHFLAWAPITPERVHVIPCCVDVSRFGPGPARGELLARYGLAGRTVIMTLARLAGAERYKGFDEVMAALPALARSVPDIAYLIVGDGPDRARLERKAAELGVRDRVVFAGYIAEGEKADHYRLADLFVMPGRGEGFGIVYLEAMACGVPVVASSLDASQEAVCGGEFGAVVDPDDSDGMIASIVRCLRSDEGVRPEALQNFTFERFRGRWAALLEVPRS